MVVTVEGVITSIEQRTKETDGKVNKFTELLLAQKGEKVQIPVRLPGHVETLYSLYEVGNFTGNLLSWKTRDSIGMMVSIREE